MGDKIKDEYDEVIDQRIKVLIVGDPGAGKKDVAKNTDICVPFKSLGFSLGKKVDLNKKINYKLTLIFWTLTKGRPRKTTYFNGASAAIIVGNLDDKNVYKKMGSWADDIISNIGWIPIYFIGKYNEDLNRRENKKKFAKLAREYHGDYYLFSSLEKNSIKRIFRSIAKNLANMNYRIIMNNRSSSYPEDLSN
jgi:hypothetical protein